MKPHHILKDFNGSHTGLDFHSFTAGTVAPLSASLAAQVVAEGWAKPVEPDALSEGPRPELVPEPDAPDILVESTVEHRETKVVEPVETKVEEPQETKPAKPLTKMTKAELVTHAMTVHKLELVPDELNKDEMIAAIEAAQKAEA